MKSTLTLLAILVSASSGPSSDLVHWSMISPQCNFLHETYPDNVIHINCPEVEIQIYSNTKHVVFICIEETFKANESFIYSNKHNNLFLSVSGLQFAEKESYKISFFECPLPNASLKSVLDSFGLKKLKGLRIRLHNNLNNFLIKKHFENLQEVLELDLSSNGIATLPTDLFQDLTSLKKLNLRNNNIVLPKGIFNFTPNLEFLELGQNKLVNLQPGIFNNLHQLKFLNLWNNRLENLTRFIFTDVPNVESLDLSSNRLKTLEPDVFIDLPKLKRLNLFANLFTRLPSNLFQKNKLIEEFQMHWNKGNTNIVPMMFLSNLTALKTVVLSACKLTSLPEDTFKNSKKIEKLFINGNSLKTLAKMTFTDLENLVYLDISKNQIESLPPEIFINNRKTRTLKLNNNQLKEIKSNAFIGLSSLEYLDLRSNKIKEIEGAFIHLENLKVLNISNNNLANLSPNWQVCETVKYSVLKKCIKLQELQLSDNFLTEIYDDWRLLMPELHTLNMASNNVTSLKVEDFNFSSEVSIDVSNNNIKTVYFKNETDLENSINEIEFSNFVRAKLVKIDNNPFECDCELLGFVQFLQFQLSQQIIQTVQSQNLKCNEPKMLKDVLLSTVSNKSMMCKLNQNSSILTWHESCTSYFRSYDKGVIVNCQNSQLHQIPLLTSAGKASHIELNIQGNILLTFQLPNSDVYRNITHFNLSNNQISDFDNEGISDKIKELDISNNNLAKLSEKTVEFLDKATELELLDIHNNPWICDCDAKPLIGLIKTRYTLIKHMQNVTCSDGRLMEKLEESDLCATNVIIIVCIFCTAIGVFIAALISFYHQYQTQIHIYCFSSKWKILRWLVSQPETEEEKKYDAFVSFSQEDELFVAEELAPGLENNKDKRYKLCLHYRDWMPGESIANQILESVQNSHRTIVVLSPSFLKSEWGKAEFRTAQAEGMRDGKTRVVVVLYEDVDVLEVDEDLKSYLQMNTYVKWGSPWFWQQLKYALPHPREDEELDGIQCVLCCNSRPRDSSTHVVLKNIKINNGEVYYGVSDTSMP